MVGQQTLNIQHDCMAWSNYYLAFCRYKYK